MKRNLVVAAAAAFAISACSGLRDALNAHTDWVAKASGTELSVTKLANLLGKSRAPIRKDIGKSIANVWVDYQLLGYAAAHNDSLSDPKQIDEAMWPAIANSRRASGTTSFPRMGVETPPQRSGSGRPARYGANRISY
jgi:peptidyl-prolyl cis-trans isomerase D